MGKKLRDLAGGLGENQLALTVKESAQQIWLAGLGAFAKAQEEGGKVFDALVKEGESIQARTRKMTDEKVAQVAGKAAGTWDRLEQVFEDRVARALGSLGVPTKQDIDKLSKRVVELSAAVQALTEGKPAARAPARSAAKPAAKEAAEAVAVASPPVVAKPAAAKPRAAAAKPVPPVTPADVLNTIPQKAGE
ncbi:MAG: phasin family protein [Candidatus Accumulibacter sp.]|uniref:phasin family protein n=1 Tax=Accumulibacter sp. TaxID=2053492 RepID=UPI00287A7348|nr:phasin family protein [Accumulibacter sp.]MDS4016479.1 phasin family protein [Accumulibacter sp.]